MIRCPSCGCRDAYIDEYLGYKAKLLRCVRCYLRWINKQ